MHRAGLKTEVCTKPSLLKFYLVAMVSAKDKRKRALVTLLRNLAGLSGFTMGVTRDSTEAEIRKAYCALSRKVHPDQEGDTEDQKRFNIACGDWCDAASAVSARALAHPRGM